MAPGKREVNEETGGRFCHREAVSTFHQFRRHLQRQYDPWPFVWNAGGQWMRQRLGSKEGPGDEGLVSRIRQIAEGLGSLGTPELTGRALRLRGQVAAGRTVEDAIPDGFALAFEAAVRSLGMKAYDCQLLAGLAICRGSIAEMATGEGKTLAAIFPAYVQALGGRGVHIATVNSYLAKRDHEFTSGVFTLLGMTSALLPERATPGIKRRAYGADITYGVGSEFGFDYLRDQVELFAQPPRKLGDIFRERLLGTLREATPISQRGLAFAILDEADSILIDEALTPLIISGSKGLLPPEQAAVYQLARGLAATLSPGKDFTLEPMQRRILLTEAGLERIYEDDLGVPWEQLQRPWTNYVENAFRAENFFGKDVHYMVQEDRIVLVDEFTGRADPDRSWREGLHQAMEVKEGVPVTSETHSLASISRQRFYRLYDKVGGMTGTAMESAGELLRVYGTGVQPIPNNRASRLEFGADRVFLGATAKLEAAAKEIQRRHQTGQPVLAGTRTIQASEQLAQCLDRLGLRYRLLNAKQDKEEAEIVSQAGRMEAITLATNMAGRGAHIGLGPGVAERGGLHVIGMERHESRRVDRQLLGRSGRQGEPGSAQMFMSAEDFLLAHYAPEEASYLQRQKADANGELPAQAALVFERVQKAVEKRLFSQRSQLMEQDHWMEQTKDRIG